MITAPDGRVLACRRAPGRAAAGCWEFPGGKVETGESPEQALAREIAEELRVDIAVGDMLTTDDTAVGERVIRLACYRAQLRGPEPTASTDHDALRWIAPVDLTALGWAAPDLPAVRLLAERG